ncbi:MAG TPA: MarR family transcriptional regulator [Enteractinococcus sp.]
MTAAEKVPYQAHFRQIPSLIYMVKSAEAASRAQMDVLLRGTNITTMQYLTLGVLLEHEALSGAALARRTFVRPQSMQDTIRALEAKGYIQRYQTSADRRERVISITDAGVELMRELEPKIATFDAALTHGMTSQEEATFRSMLQQVQANAQRFTSDDPVCHET